MEGNNMQNHIALQLETENAMDSGETMDAVEIGFEHGVENAVEGQIGTFSFEMLMPEIRRHTLSYMDGPSLCSLSMTNSLMNEEANEETLWKTLYYKDYTLDQHNFVPEMGWKARYANIWTAEKTNAEFLKTLKEKSLLAMSKIWLDTDYVQCFCATGESFSGYNEVMEYWKVVFSQENVADFQIQNVRTCVHSRVAWVVVKAHVSPEIGPCYITNVFERNNGTWYMVLHHISPSPIQAEAGEQTS